MRVACVKLQSRMKSRTVQCAYRRFTSAADIVKRAVVTCHARRCFIDANVEYSQTLLESTEQLNRAQGEMRGSDYTGLQSECLKIDGCGSESEFEVMCSNERALHPDFGISNDDCLGQDLRARCQEQSYEVNEAGHVMANHSPNKCGAYGDREGERAVLNEMYEKQTRESGEGAHVVMKHTWMDCGEGVLLSGREHGKPDKSCEAGHFVADQAPLSTCEARQVAEPVEEVAPCNVIQNKDMLRENDQTLSGEACSALPQLLPRETPSQESREILLHSAVRVLQGTCRRVQAFIDMWVKVWAARIVAQAWRGHASRHTMRLLRQINDAKNVEKRLRERGRKREGGGKLAGAACMNGVAKTDADNVDPAVCSDWGAESVNGGGEVVVGWRESVVDTMTHCDSDCNNHSAVDAHAWGSPRRKFIVSSDAKGGTCEGDRATGMNGITNSNSSMSAMASAGVSMRSFAAMEQARVNNMGTMGGVGMSSMEGQGVSTRSLTVMELVGAEAQTGADMHGDVRQEGIRRAWEDDKVHVYMADSCAGSSATSRGGGWQDASHVRRRINQFNDAVAWPPPQKTEPYTPSCGTLTHVTHATTPHTQLQQQSPQLRRSFNNEAPHLGPHSPLTSSPHNDKTHANAMNTYNKSDATSHYYAPTERPTAKYKLASFYAPSYANNDNLSLSRHISSHSLNSGSPRISRAPNLPSYVPSFATSSMSETNTPRICRPKTSSIPELHLSVRAGARPSPRYGQGLDIWTFLMQDDCCGVHDDADVDLAYTHGDLYDDYASRGLPREMRSHTASQTWRMSLDRPHSQAHPTIQGAPLPAAAREGMQYSLLGPAHDSHRSRDSDSSNFRARAKAKKKSSIDVPAAHELRATALHRPATAGDGKATAGDGKATAGDGARKNQACAQVKKGTPHANRITARR
jgi:hypothetical protein